MNVVVGSGDAAQFASIAVFGDAARNVAGLKKGDLCYVEGKLSLRRWNDGLGAEKSGLSVASFHAVPMGQIGRKRPGDGTQRKASSSAKADFAKPSSTDARPGNREHAAAVGHPMNQEIPF